MNKNLLIAFAGALLIAILVAMLMSTLLGGKKKEKDMAQETKRIQILVAAKPIGVGGFLNAENVKWKLWPEEAVFPGAIVRKGDEKTDDAASGRAARDFVIDEPIVSSALVEGDGSFMAARLEPGMRGFSIKANTITTGGGLIVPGDRVDVVLSYKYEIEVSSENPNVDNYMNAVKEQNLDRFGVQTILQNVRVLAVDQRETTVSADSKAKKPTKVKTVTLEVDTRGAEKLALGLRMGALHLSLRSLGDQQLVNEDRAAVTDSRLVKIDNEILDELVSGSGVGGVRVYNGGVPTR